MKKRVKTGMAAVMIILWLLTGRLFYIQVLCHDSFTEAAEVQYRVEVEGLDTRGQIYDRNMNPLTGSTYQYYYIMEAGDSENEKEELLGRIDAENVSRKGAMYSVYRTEQYIEEVNRRLREEHGAYVLRTKTRYSDNQAACHLVGYVNRSEKRGVSGLELLCEERLEAGENSLVLKADAAGKILPGEAPQIIGGDKKRLRGNSVVTTVDVHIQRKCESLLAGSAACVVSDVNTGELLAMASSPGFNPNRIDDYLHEDSDCLINKALQAAYPPGSVFKLAVAAAALESGMCAATRTFRCTGEAAAGGVAVSCATAPPGGHGVISMYEAMAQSCNCYFVQLGEFIGKERILAMARNLGLGEAVLTGFPEETEGNLYEPGEISDADIPNLSIGQGALLTTPLQINRLTSVIASGGKDVVFTLFSEDRTAYSDVTVLSTGQVGDVQLIRPQTAADICNMMRLTAAEGTASGLSWKVPVWAKTGTAEAVQRGRPVKNCWVTGFCRLPGKEDRCYVITVFYEDGISGSATALPVFADIVDFLSSYEA